jgi:hypothetical protein
MMPMWLGTTIYYQPYPKVMTKSVHQRTGLSWELAELRGKCGWFYFCKGYDGNLVGESYQENNSI